jgi:hypothetical protein
MVGVLQDFAHLPKGVNTVVGDQGVMLSGVSDHRRRMIDEAKRMRLFRVKRRE